jgi:hypothetical protein
MSSFESPIYSWWKHTTDKEPRSQLLRTHNFIQLLKSRLSDFVQYYCPQEASYPEWEEVSTDAIDHMHKWHKIEHLGLENRLKAMCLLPRFFCPISSNRRPRKVPLMPLLQCVRDITDAVNVRDTHSGVRFNSQVWNDGAPNRLLVAFVNGHVLSYADEGSKSPPSVLPDSFPEADLFPSWSSLAASTRLYMHTVVRLSNVKDPIDPGLIRLIALKVKWEIEEDVNEMNGYRGQASQDL